MTETGSDIKYSIVIPCYNEAACIQSLYDRLVKVFDVLSERYEMIFVNDGSTDTTGAILDGIAAQDGRARVVHLVRNFSQYTAIRIGFTYCSGEVVMTLDSDLQNPPEELPRLINKLAEGYESVAGCRADRQDSIFRRIPSIFISVLISRLTGVRLKDYGCMLRVYRREVIERINQCPERDTYLNALLTWYAPHTAEVTVKHEGRTQGTSKYDMAKLFYYAFSIIVGFSSPPFYLVAILGVTIALAGLIFLGAGLAADTVGLLERDLFIAALLMLFGILFTTLGLLGEFVVRIYQEVRQRPLALVQRTVNLHDARHTFRTKE